MENVIYEIISSDLTTLGRMGNSPGLNWRKFARSIKSAKSFCEKDYQGKINWKRKKKNLTSGDLSHVMYDIEPVQTID